MFFLCFKRGGYHAVSRHGGPLRTTAVFTRFQDISGSHSSVALGPAAMHRLGTRQTASREKRDRPLAHLLLLASDLLDRDESLPGTPSAFVAVSLGSRYELDLDIHRGDFDENQHPRWPKGTPDQGGGRFRPKDAVPDIAEPETSLEAEPKPKLVANLARSTARLIARQRLRSLFIAGLRTFVGAAADLVPVAGEIFDAIEIAQTLKDFDELRTVANAASEFVQQGPHTLNELRASDEERGFSTADAFKKIGIEKYYGSAGEGYDYHHIVEQGGANATNIPAEQLHSTDNMIRMPRLLHEEITSAYADDATKYFEDPSIKAGQTVRQWLQTQPYDVQYAGGLKVMRYLGILK